MKIFISHASANKEYGSALVDFLRDLGIRDNEIIFTSNVAYGVPNGENIFHWLKSQISERPYVIYLLSSEYYKSVACLNEMGAAWIIENEHSIIFTPAFNINSHEFQNSALDPRQIGFNINDEDRLLSFIEQLRGLFTITSNTVLINQKIKAFLKHLSLIKNESNILDLNKSISVNSNIKTISESNPMIDLVKQNSNPISSKVDNPTQLISTQKHEKNDLYSQFLTDIRSVKLKDVELILLHYIIETSRIKLMTGWQQDDEIRNIIEWEDINNLKNQLSREYSGVIRRFEMRKYTEISAVTGSGNTKEVILKPEIGANILDLPDDVLEIINKVVEINKTDPLPF